MKAAKLVIGIFLAAFLGSSVTAQQTSTKNPQEYKAGQVWKYKTALGAEESRVVVLKVELQGKKGNLVHIRIDNMPLPSCNGMHLTTAIEHLAVPEKDLRKSTLQLEREGVDLPDSCFEAYRDWQNHKKLTKRPLSEVALPGVVGPMICNWRETL
jgi:hypothetical protein